MKKIVIISLIVILLLFCGFYLYFQNTALQVTKFLIVDSKIPKSFNNYRIIQLSDFHNTTSKKLTNQLVEEITKEEPDIIVITGDLIDSRRTNVDVAIDFLGKIKDIAPIYYVSGNHESRISEYETLKKEMNDLGINLLDNEVIEIQKKDDIINLIGIDDPSFSNTIEVDDCEIIEDQIKSVNYDENFYTILLSHRPEAFKTYVNENINLIFSGHAHGGQIRLPFIGGIFVPNQGFFPKYTSGKYEEKNTTMIVSRGIGNSLFPFRINNRPELIVVELKNK
ncbi:MAG: metallophosphoesterase [Bacilli bacterium]|nr:metallophosphoesterase [Bacilli bacterium]